MSRVYGPDHFMSTFKIGERLKMIRHIWGYSQKEVASQIERNVVSVFRYEKNEQQPDRATFKRFVKIFSVYEEWLISGKVAKIFNDVIIRLMKDCGQDNEKFAKLLNVPPTYMTALINYQIVPSFELVQAAHKKFNKDVPNIVLDINDEYKELPTQPPFHISNKKYQLYKRIIELLQYDPDSYESVLNYLLARKNLLDSEKTLNI